MQDWAVVNRWSRHAIAVGSVITLAAIASSGDRSFAGLTANDIPAEAAQAEQPVVQAAAPLAAPDEAPAQEARGAGRAGGSVEGRLLLASAIARIHADIPVLAGSPRVSGPVQSAAMIMNPAARTPRDAKFAQPLPAANPLRLASARLEPQSVSASAKSQSPLGMDASGAMVVASAADKPVLAAGPLTANLAGQADQPSYPAGGAVFATLTLSAQGKPSRSPGTLALAAQGADIANLSLPKAMKATRDGDRRVIDLAGLSAEPVEIVVEVRLAAGSGAALGALTVTLISPDGAADSAQYRWPVADCAGGFHQALTTIGQTKRDALRTALSVARTPGAGYSGRWVIRPPKLSAKSDTMRECIKTRRSYNRRERAYVETCTRWREVKVPAPVVKDELNHPAQNALFTLAGDIVARRATDPGLAKDGRHSWVTERIGFDLRTYTTQVAHPALCTGTTQMLGFWRGQLGGFRKRGNDIAQGARDARAFVQINADALQKALIADTNGHPGWGGAGLVMAEPRLTLAAQTAPAVTPEKANDAALIAVLAEAARVLDGPAAAADVVGAEGVFAALRRANATANATDSRYGQGVALAAQRLFAMVETAHYLGVAETHWQGVRQAIEGTMTDIETAHQTQCRCGS